MGHAIILRIVNNFNTNNSIITLALMGNESVSINGIIILGNAVPDEISDNRKTVCTVGYSKELGLIRIYPVPPDAKMNRWEIVGLNLERNPQDTRKESWKITGSKSNWSSLKETIRREGKVAKRGDQLKIIDLMMEKYGFGCISELNERRESLGFVNPTILKYYFAKRSKVDNSIQNTLFNTEPFQTIRNYELQPRLVYSCPQCAGKKHHDQQILEWGAYEYIRKNPEDYEKIWENLKLDSIEYKKRLLVGNQALYRNSFMVISIFRNKISI